MSATEKRALIAHCDGGCGAEHTTLVAKDSSAEARLPEGWWEFQTRWFHDLDCLRRYVGQLTVVRAPGLLKAIPLSEFWAVLKPHILVGHGCKVHGRGCEYGHQAADA